MYSPGSVAQVPVSGYSRQKSGAFVRNLHLTLPSFGSRADKVAKLALVFGIKHPSLLKLHGRKDIAYE